MKILTNIQAGDAKETGRQGELAFTMIEIAIAIGVIGFALVAVIGILPGGMNSQKDAREDTIISQDAPYLMDAIRNGANVSMLTAGYSSASGLDFLTNYVQSISFANVSSGTNSPPYSVYTHFFSGAEIIGLLSTPQTNFFSPSFSNNYMLVSANIQSLSGLAAEQGSRNSAQAAAQSSMAFTYRLEVMITPFNSFAPDSTNFSAYTSSPDPNEWIIRSNRWVEATGTNLLGFGNGVGPLSCDLFDLRLKFSWPVYPSGNIGRGRQTYRAVVASQMTNMVLGTVPGTVPVWYFQPQTFATAQPPGI
jgi:hypothetical protein